MELYPVFLKIKEKRCLVVGGGSVAERKVRTLIDYGASVTLISPELTSGLKKLVEQGKIILINRDYLKGDLDGFFLAVAATSEPEVNRKIYNEAEDSGILINSVDDPDNCNFFVPSSIRRGDLQLSISTSGKAPYFAKKLRKFLEKIFYNDLGQDIEKLSMIRLKIIEETGDDEDLKKKKFEQILKPEIEDILRKIEKK
jgi:precorrin-2 dehydrogenase/sirohydrochlorin ferrochelatase